MATLSQMTFEDFEAQVRSQTGATNYSDPSTHLLMRWTNVLIGKIYLLTRGIDQAWGRDTTTLANTKSLGVRHALGDGGAYAYATKTFTGLTGLDQTYVGGWAFFVDNANSRGFYGLIDWVNVAGTSCTLRFQVGTGAAANIASANLMAIFKPNPVFYEGANLGSVSPHNVVKIVDSSLGNMVRLDSDVFSSPGVNYKNVPYAEYAGESVFVGKGSSISTSAYGTWTLWFDEKPDTITAASDTLDLRPEHIPVLADELSRWVLNYMASQGMNVTIPPDDTALILQLQNRYKKNTQELTTRRLKADKR